MVVRNISVLVYNRPGVLACVSQLFTLFETNIDKITIGHGGSPGISRIQIEVSIEDDKLEMVISQMAKLSDVLQVGMAKTGAQTRSFWIVAYSLFITIFGINVASPLYSIYRTEWQLTSGMITLLFAAYVFSVIPGLFIFLQLAERFGKRKILIFGLMAALSGAVCSTLANDMPILIMARILQGLAVGTFICVSSSTLNELERNRNWQTSSLVTAFAVTAGSSLGPFMAGILAQFAPMPTKLPYIVYGGLVILGMIGMSTVKVSYRKAHRVRFHGLNIPKTIRLHAYTAAATSFIAWGVVSLFLSVIPSYLNEWAGKFNFILSGGMIASIFALSTFSQFLFKRLSVMKMMAVGILLLSLGLMGVAATLQHMSIVLLITSAICVGLGHGPLYAGSLVSISTEVADDIRGDIISFFYLFSYTGIAFPVILLGYSAEQIGIETSVFLFALFIEAGALLSLLLWHKTKTEKDGGRMR
ncbi:acetolactate synthase, small subunit [Paenibacillus sophorae]|uniref:Acetolactate synthase, small subunit n=1 Tax=Paenibacillus sophorae TaxID=1333845 RepID=A0A1H8FSR8_9BACL|nr:MFS transporter [Paenibacillus sophorae]SEN34584.1 acetolactate synthase, small subunit [Paenibacillus sophorae]